MKYYQAFRKKKRKIYGLGFVGLLPPLNMSMSIILNISGQIRIVPWFFDYEQLHMVEQIILALSCSDCVVCNVTVLYVEIFFFFF